MLTARCNICQRIGEEYRYTPEEMAESVFTTPFDDPIEGNIRMRAHFDEKHPMAPVRSWTVDAGA